MGSTAVEPESESLADGSMGPQPESLNVTEASARVMLSAIENALTTSNLHDALIHIPKLQIDINLLLNSLNRNLIIPLQQTLIQPILKWWI